MKELKTDYLDICLLHGVRNAFEIKMRSGALNALVKAKEKGYVRCIGLSAHGIGAIEASLNIPEIEVKKAWGRTYTGCPRIQIHRAEKKRYIL